MFDLLNKIINSASKKNFLETNCILLKFLGLENAFKPACVSPIFLSKEYVENQTNNSSNKESCNLYKFRFLPISLLFSDFLFI